MGSDHTTNKKFNEHRSSIKLDQTKIDKVEEGTDPSNKKFGETAVAHHFFEKGHRVSDLK